jgi:hypothetical protein
MTAVPPKPRRNDARTRRDLRSAAAAVALLTLCGGLWLWLSATASERREKVLAAVPSFPARGQDSQPRRPAARFQSAPARLAPPPVADPKPAHPARADPIDAFVLKPAPYLALVHVNALLNTPLFARIKECVPAGWRQVTRGMAELGIDVEQDVDRLAMTAEGMAVSGFFRDKPIAQNIASHWSGVEERGYRGQTLWLSQEWGVAQVGNLLAIGPRDSMEMLLDRALDPPPAGSDPQDLYGDLFVHTDLTGLYGPGSPGGASSGSDPMRAILEGLSGVTARANVWDMVALSLEGKPQPGRDPRDLARMARGAISLVKEQLDPSDVELAALASLAKVDSSKDGLQIDLALPAGDLFDKLHFPCPGAQQAEGPASGDAPDAGTYGEIRVRPE